MISVPLGIVVETLKIKREMGWEYVPVDLSKRVVSVPPPCPTKHQGLRPDKNP
jgi:hypothetical protein